MNNGRLTIALIILIGVMVYLLIPEGNVSEASNPEEYLMEEQVLQADAEELVTPPVALTREEEAARKALRDLDLEEGSVGDKMLNFLLSGKLRFSREIYEIKNNEYQEDGKLTAAIEQELVHLAAIMQAYAGLHVEIVSHTGQNTSWEAQRKLTEVRAQACQDFLIAQGIDQGRIIATGYGASVPIADSNTERGRQLNERTEILIRKL